MVYIAIISTLALTVVALSLYLLSLRSSLKEVVRELDARLKTDTNTLISVSSGNRTVRALAAQLNVPLRALRRERLKLRNGDTELKNAVTNISHDLRTPLTAICGYLDLLMRETHTEASKRYLSIIRERTDAMREQTEELFRYSMIIGAAEDVRLESVCLNDVLEQSLAGAYGMLSKHGVLPDIHIPQQPILRMLDKQALRRILDNVLSNAAKYSDGDLTVALSPDGTLQFENSAKDLDVTRTAHLFDRFYTVQTACDGTGLGLSIAKQFTERMNGDITAQYRDGRLRICIRFP